MERDDAVKSERRKVAARKRRGQTNACYAMRCDVELWACASTLCIFRPTFLVSEPCRLLSCGHTRATTFYCFACRVQACRPASAWTTRSSWSRSSRACRGPASRRLRPSARRLDQRQSREVVWPALERVPCSRIFAAKGMCTAAAAAGEEQRRARQGTARRRG